MADPSNLPPLPANHLNHPEQWTTGSEPATEKQKGFIAVLEKQHPDLIPKGGLDENELGKSEASEVIDKLKKGEKVGNPKENLDKKAEERGLKESSENQDSDKADKVEQDEEKVGEKRKERPSDEKKNDEEEKENGVEKDDTKQTKLSTQESEKDELVSTQEQDNNEDDDIALDGKDTKDSKQTTLDGVFGGDEKKESTGDGKEDEEDRASKKPKLNSDSTTSTKPSTSTSTNSKTTSNTEDSTAYTGGYNESHPPVQADSGAIYPKPTETDTIPGSPTHLDHPENWATGDDPATEKQKGFIKVLEKQKGAEGESVDGLGKSEASEKIEELKGM